MNELAAVNLMLFLGLIGMGFGWRGGMRKLHGFYDITPAIKMVFWGIILGSFLALAVDELIFLPSLVLAEGGGGGTGTWPGLIVVLLVSSVVSLLVMFILSRRAVRLNKSAPTTGWAFGLSIGAMVSVRLGYQTIRAASEHSPLLWMNILILVVLMPQLEATICCGQGSRGQRGERWLALFWAIISRFIGYMFLTAALLSPIWWIFIIPPMMLGRSRAEKRWMLDSLTPDAQRRYRRVVAQAESRNRIHDERQRRWRDLAMDESE